jgi:hypothetical protein
MDYAGVCSELATMTVQADRRASKFQLRQMWTRIKNVTRLNAQAVLELKEDRQANGQSVAVLVIATLSSGIGFEVFNELSHSGLSPYGIIVGGLANTISFSFATVVWSITLFFVGTKLFQGKTGYWELARPMFFSAAPGALFVLVSIPIRAVYISVTIIAAVWVVLSQSFALKQAMGFNVERTLLTVGVGFLILLFVGLIFQTR